MLSFSLHRKVNHHNAVLLDNADQQDDADNRDDAEILLENDQGQQRTNAGRRQCRENGNRVNEAFIEDAQYDIHGSKRGEYQQAFIGERTLK